MIKSGKGGGNTKTGLVFEVKSDLSSYISAQKGYEVIEEKEYVVFKGKKTKVTTNAVYYKKEKVAEIYKQRNFYSSFLKKLDIDHTEFISKPLYPDDSIFVIIRNTVFIVECKHQQVGGSVDEKLQTCDFKKKEYKKLLSKANLDVEYIYILDEWFRNPKYKDVLDYIHSVGCDYYFEYIPLYRFGLPVPEETT